MKQPIPYYPGNPEPELCGTIGCENLAQLEYPDISLCDSCAEGQCERCGQGEPDFDTSHGFICQQCVEHLAAHAYDRMKDRD